MSTLRDHFADLISQLPTSFSAGTESFSFTPHSLPACPTTLEDSALRGDVRQRRANVGLIDNLILEVDRGSSTAIGLWLLSGVLHSTLDSLTLELRHPRSKVARILLVPDPPEGSGIHFSIDKFVWNPQDIGSFVHDPTEEYFLGQRPSCIFVGPADETSPEYYADRDTLAIGGPKGGVCRLAAFFLNFGLPACNSNYEYLNYEFGGRVTDSSSCELRLELAGARPPLSLV